MGSLWGVAGILGGIIGGVASSNLLPLMPEPISTNGLLAVLVFSGMFVGCALVGIMIGVPLMVNEKKTKPDNP